MNQPVTLAIGIPAYNEELNIKSLIEELLSQQTDSFQLESIIVASDGSTDRTVSEAQSVGRPEIVSVLANQSREGIAPRLNQIMRLAKSDVLVILNADVLIDGREFLEKLTAPIIAGQADMVSANLLPLPAETFFERILEAAYRLKNDMFESWKDGCNVYTCHGAARAFSRRHYEAFSFSESIAEDAFSYFSTLDRGLAYQYVGEAAVRFRLPQTFRDHCRQSHRFTDSKQILIGMFPKSDIRKAYRYPRTLMFRRFLRRPVGDWPFIAFYGVLSFFVRIHLAFRREVTAECWEIAQSTKIIRSH